VFISIIMPVIVAASLKFSRRNVHGKILYGNIRGRSPPNLERRAITLASCNSPTAASSAIMKLALPEYRDISLSPAKYPREGATDLSFVSQFRSRQVLKRDKIIRVELIVNCRVFARYRVQVI